MAHCSVISQRLSSSTIHIYIYIYIYIYHNISAVLTSQYYNIHLLSVTQTQQFIAIMSEPRETTKHPDISGH